ncbi:L-fuco-beta-pyranose dehydrogenase [Streptomyces sp. L-9-10]|nr:L-fuco-beta-pyranose dehydrogenase [Streptomyces sp. L-9-10]
MFADGAPQVSPMWVDLEGEGEVARFIDGQEAHDRMDLPARKYLGGERFEWTMPGEQRVAVIVRPLKVRHIVGVEQFRPGGPVPAP